MTHPELVSECLGRLDRGSLREIRERYPRTTHDKFFDAETFVPVAAEHAIRLNDGIPPGSRVLDFGCGFGYTAFCLELLGHRCIGWDGAADYLAYVSRCVPLNRWYLRQVSRRDWGWDFSEKFDLIYLHGVWPMRDGAGWFGWAEYAEQARIFLDGLKPGGRLEIIVNRGNEIPICCNPASWDGVADTGDAVTVEDNIISVRRGIG